MLLVLTDRTVDLDARTVVHDAGRERLTPREADLLRCLAERAGQTVTRDALLAAVWDIHRPVVTRCVDTTVHRVRGKIEADPSAPRHLFSDPGEGYRLDLRRASGEADDGRGAERARLLAAWQAHDRVYVVGPPGCGADEVIRAAAAQRGWRVGEDVHVVREAGDAPAGAPAAVVAPAPPGRPLVTLGPLAPSAARGRLLRACQRLGVGAGPELEPLLVACDAQPEPLDRAATMLQTWSVDAVLQRLADPVACFADLAQQLDAQWRDLPSESQRALAALAAIEGDIEVGQLAPALGISAEALDPLMRAGLIHEEAGWIGLGRLARAFVRAHRPDAAARRRWALGLPDRWLDQVRDARATGEALPRFPAEAIDAALDVCLREAQERAATLCRALDATVIDEGHPPEVLRAFDRVLATDIGPAQRALLLRMRGTAYRREGNLHRALRDLDEAEALATDPTERGVALGWRATVHHVTLDLDAAASDLQAAIDAIVEPRQRIACGTALAVIWALRGDHDQADARARAELRAARELDHQRLTLLAERCLGSVLVEVGETFEGQPRLERAEQLAGELGAARQRVLCQVELGRASLERRDIDRANAWFEEARQRAEGRGFAWIDAWLAELQGIAAWAHGDRDAAAGWLQAAVVRRRDEDPATAGFALGALALLHHAGNDRDSARRVLAAAVAARWPGRARSAMIEAIRARISGEPSPPGHGVRCWEHRALVGIGGL